MSVTIESLADGTVWTPEDVEDFQHELCVIAATIVRAILLDDNGPSDTLNAMVTESIRRRAMIAAIGVVGVSQAATDKAKEHAAFRGRHSMWPELVPNAAATIAAQLAAAARTTQKERDK